MIKLSLLQTSPVNYMAEEEIYFCVKSTANICCFTKISLYRDLSDIKLLVHWYRGEKQI